LFMVTPESLFEIENYKFYVGKKKRIKNRSKMVVKYGKRYLPVPLAQLFTLILFFYWLNLCAVSLADQ